VLRVAESFSRTDTGRQRKGNEDAAYARAPLFAVADGMGGAQAGEVASGIAVETLGAGLPEASPPAPSESRLAEVVRAANERIHSLSRSDEARAGMGTTMTVVLVGDEEVTIAHVGDSRAYRYRDRSLERLTDDHSLVEEYVRQGRLTPEEAREHPQRSIITRALGPEAEVEVDTRTWPARDGDVFLICSDGLTTMVGEDAIAAELGAARTLEETGHALVDAANAAGGRDNITVVLVRLEEVALAGAVTGEQPTQVGMRTAAVASAVATVERPRTEARRLAPLPGSPDGPPADGAVASSPRERRSRRAWTLAIIAAVLLVPVVLGGFAAINAVYFVGTEDGYVAIFRGLPYDLPLGVDLYERNYLSGARAADVPRPELLTDHTWRSRDDAYELVGAMERGRLAGR
jgi:protein phosphatase